MPNSTKGRAARLSEMMLKHMVRLAWSDARLFDEMKNLKVSSKGSLQTIQRYKNGTATNSPTPQIIGLISQALGFSNEERDWVVLGETVPAETSQHGQRRSGITIGLTPEDVVFIREAVAEKKQLNAVTEQKLQELSRELGETRDVIAAFFRGVGEAEEVDERWPEKLTRFAEDFRKLRVELKALDPDDPDLSTLRKRALAAVEAGALDEAKALLRGIDADRGCAVAKAHKELVQAAEVKTALGQIALLEFAYSEAAAHFHEAANVLPGLEAKKRRNYQKAEADAWFRQGDEKGDNAALEQAIAIYKSLLTEIPRKRVPLDWAEAQNNLGNALKKLGERESSTTRLEEAIVAYGAALEERTRERMPLDWATTQHNLGMALRVIGERESSMTRLEEAVAAFRAALEESARELLPLVWATMQNNLGNALKAIGERESGTARLEEAAAAYRAALEEWTREMPLHWAATQHNLGNVLFRLGERESSTAQLALAVDAYRASLRERTRERLPLDWAMTQNNLGNALWALGERESGTARLEEAVTAYRAALEEWTRERVPLDWAMTQNNLGNALLRLGERESGTAWLEQAVGAYRAALEERTRERVPLDWATTQTNLGASLTTLGERMSGTEQLRQAIDAYRAALEERTRERVPLRWAMTQNNLGDALAALGERESSTARLEEAVTAYRAALAVFEVAGAEAYTTIARDNLKKAEALLAIQPS